MSRPPSALRRFARFCQAGGCVMLGFAAAAWVAGPLGTDHYLGGAAAGYGAAAAALLLARFDERPR